LKPLHFFAHRTLKLLLLPPLPFALRRQSMLFFLAKPLLFPLALLLLELRFILYMARMKYASASARKEEKKERKGGNPTYRLGAHPSLVEYELRDLLGLG
jgi:hypothetical protein